MATVDAATRYIDNGGPYGITPTDGSSSHYTVVISTVDTGVYVGPQSMGAGSAFPVVSPATNAISGYPLTPNKEYTFEITVIGDQLATDAGLFIATPNTGGAIVSYIVLRKV